MVYPTPQIIFALLILSTAVVLIWDLKYNPFYEDQDGILKRGINPKKKFNLFKPIDSLNLFELLLIFFQNLKIYS